MCRACYSIIDGSTFRYARYASFGYNLERSVLAERGLTCSRAHCRGIVFDRVTNESVFYHFFFPLHSRRPIESDRSAPVWSYNYNCLKLGPSNCTRLNSFRHTIARKNSFRFFALRRRVAQKRWRRPSTAILL